MNDEHAPHIGLYGQCGFGNFGNDATMQVVLDHLRAALPGARFTAIVRVPETVTAAFDVPAIAFYPPPRFPPGAKRSVFRALTRPLTRHLARLANEIVRVVQAARALKSIDYLVFAGGGRFDDFNARPSEQPYWKFKWISLARLFGKPVEYVAIGAGPVDFKMSKRLYRASGRMASRRSFRDEESRRYAHDVLGIDTNHDEVVTDLVFAMDAPAARAPASPARTIGLGVMEYNNRRGRKGGPDDEYPAYIERLCALALGLLDRGYDLRILIGETCDISTARDLHARLGAAAPTKMEHVTFHPSANLHAVMDEVAKCDAVIATRFHNVVAALAMGRPVFSLGYASKNLRLMEDFGLGAYCSTLETFEPDAVLMQTDALLARAAFYGARVKARAAVHRRTALACLEGLSERIGAALSLRAPPRTGASRVAGATPALIARRSPAP